MNNLVENAINHTATDGKIIVKAAYVKESDELEVSVSDDGQGIPEEAIRKLFTKFYRVDGMHTTKGTGLGLFISKSILDAFGGHIWVESRVGQGSCFSFRIPASRTIADKSQSPHTNTKSGSLKGTHGWIKDHSLR